MLSDPGVGSPGMRIEKFQIPPVSKDRKMPNPLDYLKKAGSWMTTPMVQTPYEDAIDTPQMGSTHFDPNSMMGKMENAGNVMGAMGRGGIAGMAQGLRGMTSPMDFAGMAAGAAGPAMKALGGLGRGGQAMARMAPTLDIIEPQVVKQVAPAAGDVADLIGDMQRNLARIPTGRR